ncbi:Uncharacterized protein TCM_029850 [Theobroma cacao]|uniref:Uncharacterized protein n=1 Tax=Theobroma cacao TaxID=3641 RepID=A0A061GF92_THECC|nr:Uncharacterized protein TCM_029850 [Theobroma cacao]
MIFMTRGKNSYKKVRLDSIPKWQTTTMRTLAAATSHSYFLPLSVLCCMILSQNSLNFRLIYGCESFFLSNEKFLPPRSHYHFQ